MTIPKYDDLFHAVLKYLDANGVTPWRAMELPLAKEFALSEEEIGQEYASGNGTVFLDRLSWCLSYLKNTGLVDRPKRGMYEITPLGRTFLARPNDIKSYVKDAINQREKEKRQFTESPTQATTAIGTPIQTTPHEQMLQAFEEIREAEYELILDTILSKNPYEFEKLVVKLLEKMGYGGKIKDAGQVTKASGDGGIDGVIKEDVLGLGKIHLQAKRNRRDITVGREEIQRFVGALAVAQSNKGVFITTSSFTKHALEYSASLNGSTTLVLIDGEKLAEYIYEFGLGMQAEQTLVIKKMDSDFWDDLVDDVKVGG